ncbi:unnamed protein product [Closterium sp. NIES-64]|nr:unnamed protein product [Closterium sp. NIES-64]
MSASRARAWRAAGSAESSRQSGEQQAEWRAAGSAESSRQSGEQQAEWRAAGRVESSRQSGEQQAEWRAAGRVESSTERGEQQGAQRAAGSAESSRERGEQQKARGLNRFDEATASSSFALLASHQITMREEGSEGEGVRSCGMSVGGEEGEGKGVGRMGGRYPLHIPNATLSRSRFCYGAMRGDGAKACSDWRTRCAKARSADGAGEYDWRPARACHGGQTSSGATIRAVAKQAWVVGRSGAVIGCVRAGMARPPRVTPCHRLSHPFTGGGGRQRCSRVNARVSPTSLSEHQPYFPTKLALVYPTYRLAQRAPAASVP